MSLTPKWHRQFFFALFKLNLRRERTESYQRNYPKAFVSSLSTFGGLQNETFFRKKNEGEKTAEEINRKYYL
jgi:hypothetical protein